MSELFGAFDANRFRVRGCAFCDRDDDEPPLAEVSLILGSEWPLMVSPVHSGRDHSPSFTFSVLTQKALAQLLRIPDGLSDMEFDIRAPSLGHVLHVTGRGGEDYLGRGSISQEISSIRGRGKFDLSGLRLGLSGTLSRQSFAGSATEPSLAKETYKLVLEIPWATMRFLFPPLNVEIWHKRFKGD